MLTFLILAYGSHVALMAPSHPIKDRLAREREERVTGDLEHSASEAEKGKRWTAAGDRLTVIHDAPPPRT